MREYANFDLTNYNSYRIKSRCSKAFFPESENDVIDLFNRSRHFILLGSGHNVILSQPYYDDEFIIFNGNYSNIITNKDSRMIEVEAGAFMKEVSLAAADAGMTGLEQFYDIPSSFGGAVVMNAGASGEEIKDLLLKVRYLDLADMAVKEINKDEIGFEYRNSFFQRNKDKIVLRGWLHLESSAPESVRRRMEEIKIARWSKQPKEFPNAGNVFKRPNGHFVGALIDKLDLKGYRVGGAQISEKHGGFIVNIDNATGDDIISIIRHVKQKVKEHFDVDLEVEQRII